MIVDSHVHVHADPAGLGEKRDASPETFLANFDESPLDKAVLLPIAPVIPVEFVAGVAAQRPGRLAFFGSVDPSAGRGCLEELEAQKAQHPIVGLKLHPRRQGVSLSDLPLLAELVALAARLELPVLIDSFPYGRSTLHDDSLEVIAALAEAVPSATLIIAHMGGLRVLEALNVARTSYTIYLDLSLILPVYRGSHIEQDIFYAIRRMGAARCLYGSDYPDVDLSGSFHLMREALDANGFGSGDQDWILGNAAARLLRLE